MIHAAIIDIGSNSVRYMEAAGERRTLYSKRLTMTRLAEGLLNSEKLSEDSMERTLKAIESYKKAAEEKRLPVYAYATSAVRDAQNREEFVMRVRTKLGMETDVLSGEREAEYAYRGATGGFGVLIDIGGGSLQISDKDHAFSFPAGCIRFKNAAESGISSFSFLQRIKLSYSALPKTDRWTGVGGSITTLAAFFHGLDKYDPMIVHGTSLTLSDVHEMRERLDQMGGERARHPILAQRHDTILFGTLLLLHVMEKLGVSKITVSEKDGMEGYLEYIERNSKSR